MLSLFKIAEGGTPKILVPLLFFFNMMWAAPGCLDQDSAEAVPCGGPCQGAFNELTFRYVGSQPGIVWAISAPDTLFNGLLQPGETFTATVRSRPGGPFL